jgi:hypothetical protein
MRRRRTLPARRAVRLAGWPAIVALAVVLSACGPPAYRFQANGTNELVLKMPRNWNAVSAGVPTNQDGTKAGKGNWLAAFDAAPRPSLDHVRSNHATSPAAIMVSLAVTKEEGQGVTDDTLRDRLLPVSKEARALAALSGFTAKDFRLIRDEPIRSRTARGVHVVFSYDHGQGPEVYDQVSVTDSRKTRVHTFLVHCSQSCYEDNRRAIDETMRSFTVKIT